MCSSCGSFWIASSVFELVQPKCVCASHIPGISVAPAPSITVTPATGSARAPRPILKMRLPWTSTSPANGWAPEPSMMRTLVKSTLAMAVS